MRLHKDTNKVTLSSSWTAVLCLASLELGHYYVVTHSSLWQLSMIYVTFTMPVMTVIEIQSVAPSC